MKKNVLFYIAIFFASFFGTLIKTSEQELVSYCSLVSKVDKKLFTVFEKIKETLEIKEFILFVIVDTDDEEFKTPDKEHFKSAYTPDGMPTVLFSKKWYHEMLKNKRYSEIVGVLVHELEHHKQFAKYPGSYNPDSFKRKSESFEDGFNYAWYLIEHGADAAKAGYFDCHFCLKRLKQEVQNFHDEVKLLCNEEMAEGLKKRYFIPEDYDCYISRAEEDIKICDHCYKHENKEKSSLADVLSFGFEEYRQHEKQLYDLSNI